MNSDQWRQYIAQAELAWFRVFSSGRRTDFKSRDGAPLLELPTVFDSRQKIYAYFRHWWGPRLASDMLCNLPLIRRSGKLLVVGYDFPPISLTPGLVLACGATGRGATLRTILSGGLRRERVTYLVKRSQRSGRMVIVARSHSAGDFRLRPCLRCEE